MVLPAGKSFASYRIPEKKQLSSLLDIYEKDNSLPIQLQAYHCLSKAFERHTVHSNTKESDNNLLSRALEVICRVYAHKLQSLIWE